MASRNQSGNTAIPGSCTFLSCLESRCRIILSNPDVNAPWGDTSSANQWFRINLQLPVP